jgi:hypothetical protein
MLRAEFVKRAWLSVFLLLVALWMPSATLLGSRCGSDCPDEQTSASCPPGCHECACCPLVRVVAAPLVVHAPSLRITRVGAQLAHPPTAPAPAEIAHVPKRVTV